MAAQKRKPPSKPNTGGLKLSEKMVADLSQYLLSGCHLADAALLCDISASSLRSWRARGRDEAQRIETGGRPLVSERPYLECWQATQQSRTKRKVRALTKLQDLMNSDDENVALKATTWYLERGWPDEFGRRTRIEENEPRADPAESTDPEKQRRDAFAALDDLAARRVRKTGS